MSSWISKVKNKWNYLVEKKCESIRKKNALKVQKEMTKLEEIKKKAKENNMMPSEVNFLMLLEK